MRYWFDNQSVSLVNRVVSAAFEVPLAEYAAHSVAMIGTFWLYADMNTDWGGDTDHVEYQYAVMKKAYEVSYDNHFSDDEHERRRRNAEAIAVEFENKLWLAMIVTNMIEAMEGGARNIWATDGLIERIDKEFATDRARIEAKLEEALNS